jgi:pyruvate formate lyase activating enzyme
VSLQVRTTVDPTTMDRDDVAELCTRLRDLGVVDHVLQEVRPVGTRPEYAARLAEVTHARA